MSRTKVPEIPEWGFVTASANEAYIVSGGCLCCGGSKPNVVWGGKQWVWPWFQKVQWISLNSWGEVKIKSENVYTLRGVPVTVEATAVMQVRTEGDVIPVPYRHRPPSPGRPHPAALTLLLDMGITLGASRADTRKCLIDLAVNTLEGHQRGFLGSVTMEQLFRDESKGATGSEKTPNELIRDEVLAHAEPDLLRLGIKLVSYTIKNIDDDNGYLEALGISRTADVVAQSRIGEEENRKNELIATSVNAMKSAEAKYANKIKESKAQAERRIQVANNEVAENTAKATEDLADVLQTAKTQQQVVQANLQQRLIEKSKDVASADEEILRKTRELQAQVLRPAESKSRAKMHTAQGIRTRTEMKADGEAKRISIQAEGEASAIEAKGKATAEVITEKAISYSQYKGSALIDIVLRDIPKVSAEIAAPLANVNSLSMVSRNGGATGHARLAGEVSEIMNMIPAALCDMTGIDITKSIESAATKPDSDV